MKISIVSAYRNRKKIFKNTLLSISKSKNKNFEFIAVDDASNDDERIEDLCNEFDFLKVVRIDPSEKWYTNPCIPFNIGFKNTTGEIVMLQNPECYHVGDLLSYIGDKLTDDTYLSFGCHSLDELNTIKLLNNEPFTIENRSAQINGDNAWYNHSIYRPTGYHFASAIHKKNLNELNGFDERYALGVEYDDNEFLFRVKKFLNVSLIDEPFVLHQYHGNSSNIPNFTELSAKNNHLYHNVTLVENKIKVN